MKKFIINTVFFIAAIASAYAQNQLGFEWQKCLGGSDYDVARFVGQTADGGYIVAGMTVSKNSGDVTLNKGGRDFWVVKMDSNRVIQWQKTYGGYNYEEANTGDLTSDGGVIVAGSTNTINNGDVSGYKGGSADIWVVKVSGAGALQWQKCLGGSSTDIAYSIKQTADGGYIVAGVTESNNGDVSGFKGTSDAWVVKLNSAGVIQWRKCYGGSGEDGAYSIFQTTDGGYIMACYTSSVDSQVVANHGGYDYWVVKLTSNGSIQWAKTLGGTYDDSPRAVTQVADGGYVVTGRASSINGDVTCSIGASYSEWAVKLSSAGLIQWQTCYDYQTTRLAEMSSILATPDGGCVVVGSGYSLDVDLAAIKLDNSGVTQSLIKLGGSSVNGGEAAYSIAKTADGGYVLAGIAMSSNGDVTGYNGNGDYWVVKLKICTDVASITGDTLLCAGEIGALYASPADRYEWSNGTLLNSTISSPGINSVTVTFSDSRCSASASVNVTNLPSPTASITTSGDSPFCNGGNIDLSASGGDNYLWSNGLGVNQNISISQAGTYEVTVTNANGCSATATEVIAESPPAAPVVSSNSPVAVGSTITLSSNAIAGATYQWSGPNNFSSNQQNPSISNATALNSGDYSLVVSVNGCVTNPFTTNIVVNNSATSIVNVDRERLLFSIQPNPFNHTATLNIESTLSADLKIAVLDINGRIVENESVQVKEGKQAIEIGKTLPSGSYLLQIQTNGGKFLKNYRLIKTN